MRLKTKGELKEKLLSNQNEKIIIANYEYGKKLSQKRNL